MVGGESVGRINLDLGVNKSGFKKELGGIAKSANGMAGGMFSKLGGIIAGAFVVKKLFDFGKASIQLASDLEEVQNVVDVTFGSMAGHVNAFSKTAITSFGMSELSAKRYASTMGAMLKSSGLAGPKMLEMSVTLAGLAGDIASFYNVSTDEAFQKIRSGISGETESLKQLGINLNEVNLQEYALKQGITKKTLAMSQSEKSLLRYNYLLSVTKDAQGDFVRTSGSWANQVRIMSEQWKSFQSTMGAGFINLLTPILRGLNFLIAKLQIAAAYFRAFTEVFFGKQKPITVTAVAMDDLGGATGDVADAAKKAGKAVKGSLASFDQLNTLTQAAASSADDLAGASGGASGDMPSLTEPEIDTTSIDVFKEKILGLQGELARLSNFMKRTFGPTFAKIFDDLKPVLGRWKDSFKGVFESVKGWGAPLTKYFYNTLVPALVEVTRIAGGMFVGTLDSLQLVFDSFTTLMMPIYTWFAETGLRIMTEFAVEMARVYEVAFDSVKLVFDTLVKGVVQPAAAFLSKIVTDTLKIIASTWDKYGKEIFASVRGVIKSIKDVFIGLWDGFLKGYVEGMFKILKEVWDSHFKGWVATLLEFAAKLFIFVADIASKFVFPLIKLFAQTFGPGIKNTFLTLAQTIGTVVGMVLDVSGAVFKALGGIIDFITGVFTGDWKKAWGGLKTIVGGVFDGIAGVIAGVANITINAINSLIRGLNMLKIKIPDGVPLIGGKTLGFNIAQIPKHTVPKPKIQSGMGYSASTPRLASGGIVTQPTLAMVGEQGKKEAVIPLENSAFINNFAATIAQAVATALAQANKSGSSGGPDTLVLKVGETELGRVAIRAINGVQRQAGMTLITV